MSQYEIALVSQSHKEGLRYKAVEGTNTRVFEDGIPLTRSFEYTAKKIISVGLQNKFKEVAPAIQLSYTLLKPIYSDLKEFYTNFLNNITSSMDDVLTIGSVAPKEYVISQEASSETGLYAIETITDGGSISREVLSSVSSIYDFLAAQKIAAQEDVNAVSSWQTEYNQTFGYGVQLTVNVGALSPDVKSIKLYSFIDGVVAEIFPASCQSCRVPAYSFSGKPNYWGWTMTEIWRAKREHENRSFNEHTLANRQFDFFVIVKRPNALFWVEAIGEDDKSYYADAKMIQVYGMASGIVNDITNSGDVDNPDKKFATIIDDFGLSYNAIISDFSALNVGDRIMVSKNDCSIKYLDGSSVNGVKITNNEGVCGTVAIGKMTTQEMFYSNIFASNSTVYNLNDASIYAAFAVAQKYENQTPLDALAGTWLQKHPSEAIDGLRVMIVQSILGKDIFSGGVSITGRVVLLENLNQHTLDAEVGRLVYNRIMIAGDKSEWAGLADTVHLPTGSDEDKFCVAYAQWVEFARGTINESAGALNYFITHLFMHDDSTVDKSVKHHTLVWKAE